MQLRLTHPPSHWDFRPFDEIVIAAQEGVIRICLHAVIGEHEFEGVITEFLPSPDLLKMNSLETGVGVWGKVDDSAVIIERR